MLMESLVTTRTRQGSLVCNGKLTWLGLFWASFDELLRTRIFDTLRGTMRTAYGKFCGVAARSWRAFAPSTSPPSSDSQTSASPITEQETPTVSAESYLLTALLCDPKLGSLPVKLQDGAELQLSWVTPTDSVTVHKQLGPILKRLGSVGVSVASISITLKHCPTGSKVG